MGFNSGFKGLNNLHDPDRPHCVKIKNHLISQYGEKESTEGDSRAENLNVENKGLSLIQESTRWRSWLRHCATRWNVARSITGCVIEILWLSWLKHCTTIWKFTGSIPDRVIEIFHWHNPSSSTMALSLIRPPTGMSTRGKCGRWVGLKTLPPTRADSLEIWELEPPRSHRACPHTTNCVQHDTKILI